MFRRPNKPPQDREPGSPLFEEDTPQFKYGLQQEPPQTPSPLPSHRYDAPQDNHPSRWNDDSWQTKKTTPLPHPFQGAESDEDPETTLGEGVTFRGELKFDRLLRIDGTFEGELISEGKVVVGPTGVVKANLNLQSAIIEGAVEGNITVQERLELRGEASIEGDIKAKSITVDDGVSITGLVEVGSPSE